MFVKTENPGYVRDTDSMAVINTDIESFKNYKLMREEKLKVQKLTNEVDSLKQDLNQLKDLLNRVLEKQG
jgi:cell shape-determining protein MreC